MKTLIAGLLSFVGWSAVLASFFQVFADYYGAYWSLFWGVVFLQISRLLAQRAVAVGRLARKNGQVALPTATNA